MFNPSLGKLLETHALRHGGAFVELTDHYVNAAADQKIEVIGFAREALGPDLFHIWWEMQTG